jgi:hypothetical protein
MKKIKKKKNRDEKTYKYSLIQQSHNKLYFFEKPIYFPLNLQFFF